uniref:Uncharacterized protein n=1 Tax=Opuntia streptacantha TaxID=393608 RepID=A0A7C9ETK5_OPUST
MKSVLALGQEPEDFRRFEPVQADRALKPILLAAHQRPEPENRQRLNDKRVNAGILPPGDRKPARPVMVVTRLSRPVSLSSLAVFGVQQQQEGDRKEGGENADDHRNTGLERGGVSHGWRRRFSGDFRRWRNRNRAGPNYGAR